MLEGRKVKMKWITVQTEKSKQKGLFKQEMLKRTKDFRKAKEV